MFSFNKFRSLLVIFILNFIFIEATFANEKTTNKTQLSTVVIAKPSQNYPPYHWLHNRTVKGILPEIINQLTPKVRVLYQHVPWNRMIAMSEQGQIDAIFPLVKSASRENFLHFLSTPLINEQMVFVALTRSNIGFSRDFSNFKPFTIGTVKGYDYGAKFNALKLKTVTANNENSLTNLLLSQQIPIAIMDARVVSYKQELGYGDFQQLSIISPPISTMPLYIAFSKNNYNEALYQLFDQKLAEFVQSKQYQSILNNYQVKQE